MSDPLDPRFTDEQDAPEAPAETPVPVEPVWHDASTWRDAQPAPDPSEEEPANNADGILSAQPAVWQQPTPKKEHGIGTLAMAWLIAAVLGAGIGAGSVLYLSDRGLVSGKGNVRVVAPPVTVSSAAPGSAADVAKAVLPSIVRIDVSSGINGGIGSGVVYDDAGHILTNNHVVENASQIEVSLPNGETLPATLVGTAAPFVDIAVLKVDGGEMTPATFGRAAELQVGELAVAVGSPFGLDATVTAGVISALHRNQNVGPNERFTDAIQTDAPINPGNSGGALANARGEVVGINTAIVGGSGNVGVGFAIPIDMARRVADQIIATGRAQLSYLGITGATPPIGGGARVTELEPNGPADKAGIRVGDVIVSLDGAAIDSMETLIARLIEKDPGAKVTVVVERGGKKVTLTAVLGARPTG